MSARVVAVGLAVAFPLIMAACGGSTKTSPAPDPVENNISAIARKCRESKAEATDQITAALSVLEKHGLHGSAAELVQDMERVTTYALTQERTIRCPDLLAALVLNIEERHKQGSSRGA